MKARESRTLHSRVQKRARGTADRAKPRRPQAVDNGRHAGREDRSNRRRTDLSGAWPGSIRRGMSRDSASETVRVEADACGRRSRGCARWCRAGARPGAVAAGALERVLDQVLLVGRERLLERLARERARDLRRLERRRQVVRVDDVAVAHQHGALDAVLELAHVAGPVVAHQHVDRRGRRGAARPCRVRAAYFSTKWSASSGMSVLRSRSGGR